MANTTDLGKYLRKMRIDYGENISDMATKLAVSSAFISSVETGKRKIPSSMVTKICDLYKMSEKQKKAFFNAVASSSDKVDIPFKSDAVDRNSIAVSFATAFKDLDDNQLEEIKRILKKTGDK